MQIKVAGHAFDALVKMGLPVRFLSKESAYHMGDKTFIKNEETNVVDIKTDAHVKVFNLNDEKDLKEYESIWDRAAKGLAVISAEERRWDPNKGAYIVFLRWGDIYIEVP